MLTRFPPGHPSARGLRLPGDSVLRSMWLLAPTGTALASWIGSVFRSTCPEGLTSQTRSLDPGLRALSGTRHTFAPTKSQVKKYFKIPRVIHQTFLQSPEFMFHPPNVHMFVHRFVPILKPIAQRFRVVSPS